MRLNKLVATVAFLVLFSAGSKAQQLPNIVPPSPEAASVFKFNEVPVSLYTGVPNISIPIFEIESGGVTISITINYHSRGIKVAEIASRVGLGWSLNFGGMISRQVRGNYDEAGYGYLNNNCYEDFFTDYSKRQSVAGALNVIHDEYDFIPDQYYFNANGLSGKFIFDYTDGEILAQNYSNLKIEKTAYGFTIMDGKGNIYYFGEDGKTDIDRPTISYTALETGNYSVSYPVSHDVINTWYLTKIKTQTGKEITFSYESEESLFFRRSHDISAFQEASIYGYQHPPYDYYKSHFSRISSSQKRVEQIIFDTGKVVFEYDAQSREDLNGGKSLEGVIVYDKNNNEIKRVVFDYEYTTSDPIEDNHNTNYYLKGLDTFASKRLFLKSVQMIAPNNDTLPAYRFEYNPQLLPNRHSNSQDLWGYYNGKNNGQFLKFLGNSSVDSRAVDVEKSKAGMLKKIEAVSQLETVFFMFFSCIK